LPRKQPTKRKAKEDVAKLKLCRSFEEVSEEMRRIAKEKEALVVE